MGRPRRKPLHPPDIISAIARSIPEKRAPEAMMPVEFVETAAQNAGCVVEIIRENGKANRKRRYRLHILERLTKLRLIAKRQELAGLALHDAWCLTQLSPPLAGNEYVDAAPDPDAIAIAQVEAMQAYADFMELVPRLYRDATRRLCCDRLIPQTTQEMALARSGLTALADKLGY